MRGRKRGGRGRGSTKVVTESPEPQEQLLVDTRSERHEEPPAPAEDSPSEHEHAPEPKRKKKDKVAVLLTEEEEDSMVEWLESNPILYNKKLKTYKDTQRKEALWREKANALGQDVVVLKTWYTSLRTRYGRLKRLRSGQETPEHTERDAWILRCFEFLKQHIIEVQKRTLVSMKEKLGKPDDPYTEDAAPDTDDDDNPTSVTSEQRQCQSLADNSSSSTQPTGIVNSSRVKKSTAAEDDTLIKCLSERSEQFLTVQKQLLDHIRPEGDMERNAFVEWLRSALHNLEHSVWRRCQRELSDVMYRFIAENDALGTNNKLHCQPSSGPPNPPGNYSDPGTSSSHTQSNQAWQPGPQYWPASVQNPTSVWGSMDSSWVQQQCPNTQSNCQMRSQPSENVIPTTTNQLQRSHITPTTQFSRTQVSPQLHFSSLLRDIQDLDKQDSSTPVAAQRPAST